MSAAKLGRFVPCGAHIPARIFIKTCADCRQTYCRRHPCEHVSNFKAEGSAKNAAALMAEIDAMNERSAA
jgi:hypothetical protein